MFPCKAILQLDHPLVHSAHKTMVFSSSQLSGFVSQGIAQVLATHFSLYLQTGHSQNTLTFKAGCLLMNVTPKKIECTLVSLQ